MTTAMKIKKLNQITNYPEVFKTNKHPSLGCFFGKKFFEKDNWLHQAIDATSNGSFTHRILRNIQSKQDKEFM